MIRTSILGFLAMAVLGQLALGNTLNKGRPCVFNRTTLVQSDEYCTLKVTFYTKKNLKGEKIAYHLPPFYHAYVQGAQNTHLPYISCINLPPRFAGRVLSLKVEDPALTTMFQNSTRHISLYVTKNCSAVAPGQLFVRLQDDECWLDFAGTFDQYNNGNLQNCTIGTGVRIESFYVQYNYPILNPNPTEASG